MMKKFQVLVLFIACIVLTGVWNVQTGYAAEGVYGDVDGKEGITVRDSLAVLQHAAGIQVMPDSQLMYADVNQDGVVNGEDALQILEYCVCKIADFKANEPEFSGTIWIAGDSIAAPTAKNGTNPRYGWGEVLGEYFQQGVTVNNCAVGGCSSKSFLQRAEYKKIMDGLQKGDVLFIGFGHNDMKGDDRYTNGTEESDVEGSYKWYLKTYYIDPALEKGALPIVLSSVVRCTGDFSGTYQQAHHSYAASAIEMETEYRLQNVYLPTVDLYQITFSEYQKLGKQQALQFHADAAEDSDDIYDTTHYNERGARWCSQLILSELQKLDLKLCAYIDTEKVVDPRTE